VDAGRTVQGFVRLNSEHVCGSGGTIAAVTKVHCLCDVSCRLSKDREGLQGIFLPKDVVLECYKWLKESLGSHVSSYETVPRWVSAIKNGREETDDASRSAATSSATDERHKEKVKFVLERTHGIGESKNLCKVDSTCAQRRPKSHACSACHRPSAALQK